MKTSKLVLVTNYDEIKQAEKLGINIPQINKFHTKLLFWKKDVKKAFISTDNTIILEFEEGSHEIEFDKKFWDELELYFIENEE